MDPQNVQLIKQKLPLRSTGRPMKAFSGFSLRLTITTIKIVDLKSLINVK